MCSGIIGIERSMKNRPAGFRTHLLVGIGTALASLVGHYVYLNMHMPADLTRIGASVISGLGFLGAGTIIVTGNGFIKGLTTAAGLWTTGIVGLAIGAGFYEGGIAAAVFVLFIETVMARLGAHIGHMPEFRIKVHYSEKSALDDVLRFCKNKGISIADLRIRGTSDSGENPDYYAMINLRAIRKVSPEVIVARIASMEKITDVSIQ
ncbi:MAG: MgtC/SapB family protein [Lachnospiraceae bacterium]|nr:MgtC/SapB family protein [Lachnospiraceae bacterium]